MAMETKLPLMLWLALGNLLLMLDCLISLNTRVGAWFYDSLICHALRIPMGGLPTF